MSTSALSSLSDSDLLGSARALNGTACLTLAEIIAHLVEIEDRRLHVTSGCRSMFYFCIRRLGFHEGETARRLALARLARKFPSIIDAIGSGRVHMTNVLLLKKHFTEDNVSELLDLAGSKTKSELKEHLGGKRRGVDSAEKQKADARAERIERLLGMTTAQNPKRDVDVLIDAALEVYEQHLLKKRFAQTDRPSKIARPAAPGHVSNSTKRDVIARDGLRCAWLHEDGTRCNSTDDLEFDHIIPRRRGGTDDVANVRVVCRKHNLEHAEQVYGREHVRKRIIDSRRRTKKPSASTRTDAA